MRLFAYIVVGYVFYCFIVWDRLLAEAVAELLHHTRVASGYVPYLVAQVLAIFWP
jgi:hypothetical protein